MEINYPRENLRETLLCYCWIREMLTRARVYEGDRTVVVGEEPREFISVGCRLMRAEVCRVKTEVTRVASVPAPLSPCPPRSPPPRALHPTRPPGSSAPVLCCVLPVLFVFYCHLTSSVSTSVGLVRTCKLLSCRHVLTCSETSMVYADNCLANTRAS